MITAAQLVAHAIGDYLIQSDWMANEKTKRWTVAYVHALTYALPFLLLTQSPLALFVIAWTHAIIDRLRLARYVVFAKNFLGPRSSWPTWSDCVATGYPSARPPWLSVWLLIVADNVIHVCINGAAIAWLGKP